MRFEIVLYNCLGILVVIIRRCQKSVNLLYKRYLGKSLILKLSLRNLKLKQLDKQLGE